MIAEAEQHRAWLEPRFREVAIWEYKVPSAWIYGDIMDKIWKTHSGVPNPFGILT